VLAPATDRDGGAVVATHSGRGEFLYFVTESGQATAVVLYDPLPNGSVTNVGGVNGDTRMQLNIELNGNPREFDVSKTDSLLDALRKHGYTGAKRGCDTGACGFCTVVVDGEPVNSCVTPVAKADGATVETIEGLGSQADLHPVQQAFVDHSALQCGFCIPGMIMRSKALLDENSDPTEAEVREGLSDNLCRCTGYKKIVEAVLDAADRMDGGGGTDGRRSVATDGGEQAESLRTSKDERSESDAGQADGFAGENGECCGEGGECR
jgi:carbon-monoxide dehydrogenase small subunit